MPRSNSTCWRSLASFTKCVVIHLSVIVYCRAVPSITGIGPLVSGLDIEQVKHGFSFICLLCAIVSVGLSGFVMLNFVS